MAKTEYPINKPKGDDDEREATPVTPTITLPALPKPKRKALFRISLSLSLLALLFLFPITTISSKLSVLYIFANDGLESGRKSGSVQMRNGRQRKMSFFATVLNAYTSAAKAVFAFFNSNWNALTNAQRIAWNGYTTFVSDRFARQVKVTGKTAYVQLNINIANVAGTATTAPPATSSPKYTSITSLATAAGAGTMSLVYVLNAAGATTLLYATRPLSQGVFKPSASEFRLFAVGDTSAASPLSIATAYTGRFGAITGRAGKKIFLRAVVVDATTGLTSIAAEVVSIIAA